MQKPRCPLPQINFILIIQHEPVRNLAGIRSKALYAIVVILFLCLFFARSRDFSPPKRVIKVVLILCSAALATPSFAQTSNTYSNTTAIGITDNSCPTMTTRTFAVGSIGVVNDINISVAITHGDRGQLRLQLRSPSGTIVPLMDGIGGTLNNLNSLFDDEIATDISAHTTQNDNTATTPYQRSYNPTGSLASFDGESATGTWRLEMCDKTSGSTGSFVRSNLYVTATARTAGTPPTLTCPIGTTIFDWDSNAWPVSSTSNTYAISNIGNVSFGIAKTGGTWITDATYGGTAPFRQNLDTYGFVPAQYMLQQWIDFGSSSDTTTTTITLPTAVPGLQFKLYDVDYGDTAFADKITVTGTYGAASVTPTLTNGVTNYVVGNVAIGDAPSALNSANGVVHVTFASPVDKIVIQYGNHTTAPANPSAQAFDIHDITFCRPQANLSVTKISSVLSDPVNGASDAKAIPGATLRYCIMATNSGSATIKNMGFSDPLPAATTYVPGSMKSGTSCAGATNVEDDDSSDGSETDAIQATISGTSLSASAATMGPSATYAIVFEALLN